MMVSGIDRRLLRYEQHRSSAQFVKFHRADYGGGEVGGQEGLRDKGGNAEVSLVSDFAVFFSLSLADPSIDRLHTCWLNK